MKKYNVACYVKLAKLWERAEESARVYHYNYFHQKYADSSNMEIVDVYIDITGAKNISKRPEMVRLLRDCTMGKIDCISTQTKAYLAANSREFCYLMKFILDNPKQIEIVTEDVEYNINTINNAENQRQELLRMANDFVDLDRATYEKWKKAVVLSMNESC